MSLFQSILEDLANKIKGKEFYKDNIAKELTEILGINIKPDQLIIKNNYVILNVSPTIKTVVKIKRDILIKALNKFNIKDIK